MATGKFSSGWGMNTPYGDQWQAEVANARRAGFDTVAAYKQSQEAGAAARRAWETQQSTGAGWSTDEFGRTVYRSGAGSGSGSSSSAGGGTGTGVDFNAALRSIPDYSEPMIQGPSAAEDQAALTASYARAKERAGLESQGAAKSIRALMARRGLGGSKFALGQESNAIRGGQAMLGEYGRDESLQLAKRRQNVADMTYGGGITQRGQTLSAKQNRTNQALSLAALQQRGAA